MEKELCLFQQSKNTQKMEKGRRDMVFSQGDNWKCIFSNCDTSLERKSKSVNAEGNETVSRNVLCFYFSWHRLSLRIAQYRHHLIF